jgi:hypothetical protein
MTPFTPLGTPPPADLPSPEPPPANFRSIGTQAAVGAQEGGFWQGLWRTLLDAIPDLVGRLVAAFVSLFVSVGAWIAQIFLSAEAREDPVFARLTEVAIEDLFGVQISIGGPGAAGRAGRQQAAQTIGQAILRALAFGGDGAAGAQPLAPSSARAEQFLTVVTQLALEGWLEGVLFELVSLGQMEKFADLDDMLADVLGLGRLTRRVLAPPLQILVETPYTWLLNRTYRPTLLSPREAIRQYIRGRYTATRLFYELSLAGYKDEDIEALIAVNQQMLSEADVFYLLERGIWSEPQALQHLRDQGWTQEMAQTLLAAMRDRKIDTYRRQAAGEAADAYVRRDIDEQQLRDVLAGLGLPAYEEEWIRRVAGFRREFRTRDLTVSEMEQAVKRGIRTIQDFRAYLLKQGYSFEDAQTLELLLMTDIADAETARKAREERERERQEERLRRLEEAERRRQEREAQLQQRGLSLAQMEALVQRGLRSIEQYRAFLRAQGFSVEDVTDLATLLQARIDDARAAEQRRAELEREARRRRISLGDLERAVRLGLLSVDEYRSQLAAAGFSDQDRDLLAALLQRELDREAEEARRREEAKARLAEQRISLDALETAVRRGLRSPDQYRAELVARGFTTEDADLLTEILRQQLKDDQAARDRRAKIEAELRRKRISLQDLETAVRRGLRTITEYRATLTTEGYSDADADLLVRLLELQMQADRDAAMRRAEAERRLAERRISLGDLERAVRLGVVPMFIYQQALAREGFSREDQMILTSLLSAELARTREAERLRRRTEQQAVRRRISLADMETAVRLGIRTMQDYQALLTELGLPERDQETLVALLQERIAQDQAARERRGQVEGELAQRGLSLARAEQAVRSGVWTVAQYEAWLEEQGYDEISRATLVALLQLELAARAGGPGG